MKIEARPGRVLLILDVVEAEKACEAGEVVLRGRRDDLAELIEEAKGNVVPEPRRGTYLSLEETNPHVATPDYAYQLVYARAWNEAVAQAALVVCPFPHVEEERECAEVARAIRRLKIPFRPLEDEAKFARRDQLIDQETRTTEEEIELRNLRLWAAGLPTVTVSNVGSLIGEVLKQAQRLSQIYFDIAASQIGEEEVRRLRDVAIAEEGEPDA